MNEQLQKALNGHVRNILEKCKLEKGIPRFGFDIAPFISSKFVPEVKKHTKDWLRFEDIYWFLVCGIIDYIKKSVNPQYKELSGDLKTIISAVEIEKLSLEIVSYIEVIPIEYQIHFDLPAAKPLGLIEVGITENISLIEVNETDFPHKQSAGTSSIGSLLGIMDGVTPKKRVHVCINVAGYADDTLESSAVKKAFSIFKQFILLGEYLGIFKRTKLVQTESFFNPNINDVFVRYKDKKAVQSSEEGYFVFSNLYGGISLPRPISDYISSIAINEEMLNPRPDEKLFETFENVSDPTSNDKAKVLKKRLEQSIKLFKSPESDTDAERIKTALEWALDATLNDNDTIAFIQTCIGLEALLGDDQAQENLTETLSDRCSYLIGNSFSKRIFLKKLFKDIYKYRSKLVHGRKRILEEDEKKFLFHARKILRDIILKELAHIG